MAGGTRRFRDGRGWERKAGYSRAVRRGSRIHVSGTTAADSTADTYAQTLQALEQALAAVEELGGTKADVTRTRVMLTPEADWTGAARAHAQVLGEVAPANTMLYVAGLIGDGYLVEVEVEAELEA
ncbi:MAG TPA: Rid family hydrolase [Candidatus Dormibacteraeota bacterium]|nr:Rid family hydrolase [Candidatus Dormibacteraeota bacterium]